MEKLIKVNSFGEEFDSDKGSFKEIDLKSGNFSADETIEKQKDLEANKKLYADNRFKWSPTSELLLEETEKRILSFVKTPYEGYYVNVGKVAGQEESKVWTLSFTGNGEQKIPLVLLHGMGSGVALWGLNFDELAADRHVHAFDMLGFARSSRPKFSSDPAEVESELVESIEEWRKEMKLERFVLLGHSMGGFLVTSYAMRYPNRVAHLILADPWGFPEEDPEWAQNFPIWARFLANFLRPFNPLFMIRATGPIAPRLVKRFRNDLIKKYSLLSGGEDSVIADYIYHCNVQKPSGEAAFHTMRNNIAWARNPMQNRLNDLPKEVPMTIIYGGMSWVRQLPDQLIRESRPNSYVDIQRIPNAGHHVMADNWHLFNSIVLKASKTCDKQNRDE